MPTPSTVAFGRLARKLVNESRIVQISGKMLIASSRSIVGPMKSHAMARSERPRTFPASAAGVAAAARVASVAGRGTGLATAAPCGSGRGDSMADASENTTSSFRLL